MPSDVARRSQPSPVTGDQALPSLSQTIWARLHLGDADEPLWGWVGDNFDLKSGHVLPSLIRKAHEAKQQGAPELIWASSTPTREFLHVDDCADALVHLLKTYSGSQHINVGSGSEIGIFDLILLVARVVSYEAAWSRFQVSLTAHRAN
jgi:nucleoside-diphosphate-sugar epimerase